MINLFQSVEPILAWKLPFSKLRGSIGRSFCGCFSNFKPSPQPYGVVKRIYWREGGVLSCSEGKSFGFCRKASNLFITKFCIHRLSYAITNDSSQNVKGVCDCWGHAFSQENSSHSNHCQKVWGISGGKKSICKVFLPHSSVADLKLLNLWRNIFLEPSK